MFINYDTTISFELAKIHTIVVGRLQTNCYILQSNTAAIIIDPGDEPERIIRFIRDIKVKPSQIIATHTHFDHVLGVDMIRTELSIPFLIHRDDLSMLESMQNRVASSWDSRFRHRPR